MLFFTTTFLSKWQKFLKEIKDKKKLIALFLSGFLIFVNWSIWIYAVASERIIDASFGYFIMPIISVLLGYIFFNEKLNKNFIKNLTDKLLSWTGERWIISLSKNSEAKSIHEKNLEIMDIKIDEFKKSKIAKDIEINFPDAKLIEIKEE